MEQLSAVSATIEAWSPRSRPMGKIALWKRKRSGLDATDDDTVGVSVLSEG